MLLSLASKNSTCSSSKPALKCEIASSQHQIYSSVCSAESSKGGSLERYGDVFVPKWQFGTERMIALAEGVCEEKEEAHLNESRRASRQASKVGVSHLTQQMMENW